MNIQTNKNLRGKSGGGFTLVELVVAVGIFSLVTLVLAGAFVATFRSQRSAFAFLHMQNNVRHALEVMSREMRTGTGFVLPASNHIRFIDDRNRTIEYCLHENMIRKTIDHGPCPLNSLEVTAAGVRVENLQFVLTGAAADDGQQPRITILLRIVSGGISADLQTTITQRQLDT
jgi:type II secretory pathway pseudopilin PulG